MMGDNEKTNDHTDAKCTCETFETQKIDAQIYKTRNEIESVYIYILYT